MFVCEIKVTLTLSVLCATFEHKSKSFLELVIITNHQKTGRYRRFHVGGVGESLQKVVVLTVSSTWEP